MMSSSSVSDSQTVVRERKGMHMVGVRHAARLENPDGPLALPLDLIDRHGNPGIHERGDASLCFLVTAVSGGEAAEQPGNPADFKKVDEAHQHCTHIVLCAD